MAYISSTATVYAGPSTGGAYRIRDTLNQGLEVIVLFQHGNYYYVSYRKASSSASLKGGYVRMDVVSGAPAAIETISQDPRPALIRWTGWTYYGPSSDYAGIDRLQPKTPVSLLGIKEDGYELIEYAVSDSNGYEVGYFAEDRLCDNLDDIHKTFKFNELDSEGNIIAERVYIPAEYPMGGYRVTQGFNDTTTNAKGHLGYDLVCDDASKTQAVCALFDGVVAAVKPDVSRGNGRVICLRHNVRGTEFYSAYCHLANPATSTLSNVFANVGDVVTAGERIATIGRSGNGSETGYDSAHLHVCVFTADEYELNPWGYASKSNDPNIYQTFEEASNDNYFEGRYCYGPDEDKFPHSDGLCFYDPYGVVSTDAEVIRLYPAMAYEEGHWDYSIFDVNRDGVVDQNDIARAQRYFGKENAICDVDGNGEVDIADLTLILNNFTE